MKFPSFSILISPLLFIFLSGCATFDGLRTDVRAALSSIENISKTPTPATSACEPLYERRGDNSRYKECLRVAVERNLSGGNLDAIYFGKVFPKCLKNHRIKKGDFHKHRICQREEYIRKEINRRLNYRKSLDRRN